MPPFNMSHRGIDDRIHQLFIDATLKGIRGLIFLDEKIENVIWFRAHPADVDSLTNLIGFAYNQYLPRTIDIRVRTLGEVEQSFTSGTVLITSGHFILAGKTTPKKP